MINPAHLDRAVDVIQRRMRPGERLLAAVTGPPGTGKSTFSAALLSRLGEAFPQSEACVVPMDGFHLDNVQLDRLGLRARKGAPQTFDFQGFESLLRRVRSAREETFYPVFDRARDLAIAGAGVVLPATDIVIVEGNYLMLDETPWAALDGLFDVEFFLRTPFPVLEARLVQRWLEHGHDAGAAVQRARSNDIPNAELVTKRVRASERVVFLDA